MRIISLLFIIAITQIVFGQKLTDKHFIWGTSLEGFGIFEDGKIYSTYGLAENAKYEFRYKTDKNMSAERQDLSVFDQSIKAADGEIKSYESELKSEEKQLSINEKRLAEHPGDRDYIVPVEDSKTVIARLNEDIAALRESIRIDTGTRDSLKALDVPVLVLAFEKADMLKVSAIPPAGDFDNDEQVICYFDGWKWYIFRKDDLDDNGKIVFEELLTLLNIFI